MHRRRGKQSEHQASLRKFLEQKDPFRRLKFLKHGLEKAPLAEVKEFFTEHSSVVFHVFHTSFTAAEAAIRDKVSKGKGYSDPTQRELTDVVLPALEKILITLPELVHKRWQFNCICLVIRKLLHPQNPLNLRQYAIKLLVLWLQALQENAGDACMQLFASAVPHFPPEKTPMGLPLPSPSSSPASSASSSSPGLCDRYGTYSASSLAGSDVALLGTPTLSTYSLSSANSSREVVGANVLPPLGPAPPGLSEDDIALQLMAYLLKCLTTQVGLLKWDDPGNHLRGFAFLFFLFKLFYLACLFKGFRSDAGLYTQAPPPEIKFPSDRKSKLSRTEAVDQPLPEEGPAPLPNANLPPTSSFSLHKKHTSKRGSPYRMSSVIKLEYNISSSIYTSYKNLILQTVLAWVMPEGYKAAEGVEPALLRFLDSPAPSPSPTVDGMGSFVPSGVELMREMWFTSRDNINLLLEITRQGLAAGLTWKRVPTVQNILDLYEVWTKLEEKPIFMHSPPESVGAKVPPAPVIHVDSLAVPSATQTAISSQAPPSAPPSLGCMLPWEQLSHYEGFQPLDTRAGLQASLRMIVSHTSQVFFSVITGALRKQVEICKRVITLYQSIAQSWALDPQSWEYLLQVLLYLTLELLRGPPPGNREDSLGGCLASLLLKTVLGCYIRAAMVSRVPAELWDSLLSVLSSLTRWREVVAEWKVTMETMTHVLAKTVYGLDLTDLPLSRLARDPRHRAPPPRHRAQPGTLAEFGVNRAMFFLEGLIHVPIKGGYKHQGGVAMAGHTPHETLKQPRVRLKKSTTEVRDEDSPPRSGPNRHVSVPHIPGWTLPKDQRSVSTAVPPILESLEVAPESMRSHSIDTCLPASRDDTATPSSHHQPDGSPAESVFSPSPEGGVAGASGSGMSPVGGGGARVKYQRLEWQDTSSGSAVVVSNPCTTSPEATATLGEGKGLGEAIPSRGEGLGGAVKLESDRNWREDELSGLVLTNIDYFSPEPTSSATPTPVLSPAPTLPDSGAAPTEGEESDLDKGLRRTSRYRGSGGSFRLDRTRGGDFLSRSFQTTREGELSPRLQKSSSESNLQMHRIRISHAEETEEAPLPTTLVARGDDDEGTGGVGEEGPIVFRRVMSTGTSPLAASVVPQLETNVGDLFTTSIIPISSSGLVSPPPSAVVSFKDHTPRSGKLSPPANLELQKRLSGKRRSRGTLPTLDRSGRASPPHALSPGSAPYPGIYWNAKGAALVWQRMLKVIGDINAIAIPAIHAEAFACLQETCKTLRSIEANSGISLDNRSTPPLPPFAPPLFLVVPWILVACLLPESYHKGRVIAHQMLCDVTVRHYLAPPPSTHLTHFYRLMHTALQPSSDVLRVAVKSGCRLFSHGLLGASILLPDCLEAVNTILSSRDHEAPRMETLCLLGSMLFLPKLYSTTVLPNITDEGGGQREGVEVAQMKEKLLGILFTAAQKEPHRNSRCLALYQVGILVFSELQALQPSSRLPEGVDILLASLQFPERSVAMAAIDMLSLLTEVGGDLVSLYPGMTVRVVEAICYAIAVFMNEESEQPVSWADQVIVTLILCLRDWLMALPLQRMVREGSVSQHLLKTVFEVLQAAAGDPDHVSVRHARAQLFSSSKLKSPVSVSVAPLDSSSSRSPNSHSFTTSVSRSSISKRRIDDVHSSVLPRSSSLYVEDDKKVQVAAKSVLTHLLNVFGHFPFGCGAAQFGSSVKEYHDCPSLQDQLDDLATDIFDSPRVQFFSFNDSAVISFVEIPTMLEGVPRSLPTPNYQARLIVRDLTGKYTWDCTQLYGLDTPTDKTKRPSLITDVDSADLAPSVLAPPPEATPPLSSPLAGRDPLQPPSYQTHLNSNRDILEDLLLHLESTSPEVVLSPGRVGLCEPVLVESEEVGGVERDLEGLVQLQQATEQSYVSEAFQLRSMRGERAMSPKHDPTIFAFHYCRVFLHHLNMFSWSRRSHVDLLDKNNQLILELKHLDSTQTQSRQAYKVAVLYVAPGQEDKQSILTNTEGSRPFEEFVAGLGWEVDMQTHTGYMGGLNREFCAGRSLPYYATSSEEVLFHVSTRMPSRGSDVGQKVRHLGNDEVHIVWSEHWRDYRRTIFKTQFADILIIIYPLPNQLFRIQINRKQNSIPQFGPLFDGALVDKDSLPSLVRATAINALRAQRSPLVSYRGRYEDRLKYIHSIVEKKLRSSFEDFTQSVMQPLDSVHTAALDTVTATFSKARPLLPASSHSLPSQPKPSLMPTPSATPSLPRLQQSVLSPSSVPSGSHSPDVRKGSPRVTSLLKLPGRAMEQLERTVTGSPPVRRARAHTNDDRLLRKEPSPPVTRNRSVPDNLQELGGVDSKTFSTSSLPSSRKSRNSSSKGSLSSAKPAHQPTSPCPSHTET